MGSTAKGGIVSMKKLYITKLLTVVMVLLFTLTSVYSIEEESVEFIIHKRMYVDPEAVPDEVLNSGLLQKIDDSTYGFNDVEFTVYDMSNYFSDQTLEYEDLASMLNGMSNDNAITFGVEQGQELAKLVTKTMDGEAGLAKFRVNPLDYADENQVFMFVETKTPDIEGKYDVIHKGTPMLIVLPVENPQVKGDYLKEIHLYPKNFGYIVDEEPTIPDLPKPPVIPNLPSTGISNKVPVMATTSLGLGFIVLALSKYRKKEEEEK